MTVVGEAREPLGLDDDSCAVPMVGESGLCWVCGCGGDIAEAEAAPPRAATALACAIAAWTIWRLGVFAVVVGFPIDKLNPVAGLRLPGSMA